MHYIEKCTNSTLSCISGIHTCNTYMYLMSSAYHLKDLMAIEGICERNRYSIILLIIIRNIPYSGKLW